MDDLLVALAGNPALPPALADRLIGLADEELACALAAHPGLTGAQVRELAGRFEAAAVQFAHDGRLSADDLPEPAGTAGWAHVALALLDAGRGRAEWARQLAAETDPELRQELAVCPDLPPDVRERLAADPDPEVVAELAWRTTDQRLLARLARHRHAEVRVTVAANRATPPELLAALVTNDPPPEVCQVCEREPIPFVHDPHCARTDCTLPPGAACDGSHQYAIHSLRCQAVDNPATPMSSLVSLADNESAILRWTLAARPDLPPGVAARLAGDPIPGVRHDLAGNPGLPDEVLRRLAGDKDPEVRRRLAHNPKVPLDVLAELAATTRIGPVLLPRVEAATDPEVRQLAASPVPEVRMLLATRRDLPPEVRDALAGDPDAKVVAAVAGHPGLSVERLAAMVAAQGVRVKSSVAANPEVPADLLLDLARQDPRVPKALREIARHPHAGAAALEFCLADERARPIAAGHPALPPDRVAELLGDADPQVAESAAGNPSLPVAAMERLIADLGARGGLSAAEGAEGGPDLRDRVRAERPQHDGPGAGLDQ
ncbi:hypothetical protein GCM10010168_66560 [Actinoplanes ianthinogenes]|uniref:Leucine rich repeat variant n=1 Tax=Actinoplanes ianthinogenes TaxID=122358 RepID=A0ABN6CHB4_9ACTN|nr:hypothetical protein [Actinoplanes ianthinogenes]BCJ43853.1 hypothetical protein Aiant_45100 [Actinoplanes ianthinogenes]GGR38797.1 hypothetical protein GCM10010168_66560 [Actinoplanes ianthinogenes]